MEPNSMVEMVTSLKFIVSRLPTLTNMPILLKLIPPSDQMGEVKASSYIYISSRVVSF